MTKELLQQALDALITSIVYVDSQSANNEVLAALNAVEQALAQQEQPASVDAYVGAREDAAIWKKRALEAEELNRKFIAELNGQTYLGEPVKQEQPAQEPLAVVPRTMILEDADLRFLHGLSQPDDEDGSFSPIALTVGDGHAGHGLYASLSEYPEEGADIICKFAAPTPPAQEPFAYGRDDEMKAITSLEKEAWISAGRARVVEAYTIPLYTHPAPTQPALSDEQALLIAQATGAFDDLSLNYETGKVIATVKAVIEAYCQGGASHMNNQEFQERVVEILENLVSSMDQRDFGWVLRQVRNLYEDVREAAKQGGASNAS